MTSHPADRPVQNRQAAPDDADALREEIAATREDVGDTIDAITGRLEEGGRRAITPAISVAVAATSVLLIAWLVRRRRPSPRAAARKRAVLRQELVRLQRQQRKKKSGMRAVRRLL